MTKQKTGLFLLPILIGLGAAFGQTPEVDPDMTTTPIENTPSQAFNTCQAFATHMALEWKSDDPAKITLSPVHYTEDKYEDKVGSQFVSTIVSGKALLKPADSQDLKPMQYICLLANDKKAVFFMTLDPFNP